MAGNINSEKKRKFNLPFMVCVLAPLSPLTETVKNEAFGCWLVGTAHMVTLCRFLKESVKVVLGSNSAIELSFVTYKALREPQCPH
jgi:hypothetical protein